MFSFFTTSPGLSLRRTSRPEGHVKGDAVAADKPLSAISGRDKVHTAFSEAAKQDVDDKLRRTAPVQEYQQQNSTLVKSWLSTINNLKFHVLFLTLTKDTRKCWDTQSVCSDLTTATVYIPIRETDCRT